MSEIFDDEDDDDDDVDVVGPLELLSFNDNKMKQKMKPPTGDG